MAPPIFHGLPEALRRDGWWLDDAASEAAATPATPARPRLRIAALVGLTALGDALIWDSVPGLALALYCLCLVSVAGFGSPRLGLAFLITLLAVLPWVEERQALSFLFLSAGTLAAAAVIAAPTLRPGPSLLLAAARLALCLPVASLRDLYRRLNAAPQVRVDQGALSSALRDWGLPVGGAVVFGALFVAANPLFDAVADVLEALSPPSQERLVFWLILAALVWPFLTLSRFRERLRASVRPRALPALPQLINAGSVARSLVVLNLIFAVQTVTDLAYLWGGVTLPEGMSYAEYAHRGAYPLLFAALLAGLFAIVAQNHLGARRVLLALLSLWVAQTVLLVASSALRLELYIEVYGLTRLRLAAAIWMATVLAGLALLSVQITTGRTVRWLLSACAWLGLGVLYATMFLSFDRTIARYNLTHDVRIDQYYLCTLGRAAEPEIAAYNRRHGTDLCDGYDWYTRAAPPDGFRAWGFREWRTARSLAALTASQPGAHHP